MIKVEAINGAPSQMPIEFTGSHFDGEYFYFFESEAEKDTFYNSLNTWSKEAHLAEINALHEAEFERRWLAAGYKTEEELSRAVGNPKNKFHAEAMLIDDYWWDGWDAIEAYGETVTEQNFIDPQTFVDNLENI
jgi:hypothetical protein